mmetsp:Transcript_18542/g.33719  ORF Transcript_18542/g.33719 Transcript_18542/m.33719 type:complete len:210 (-) Transcript_18542:105-734(-)
MSVTRRRCRPGFRSISIAITIITIAVVAVTIVIITIAASAVPTTFIIATAAAAAASVASVVSSIIILITATVLTIVIPVTTVAVPVTATIIPVTAIVIPVTTIVATIVVSITTTYRASTSIFTSLHFTWGLPTFLRKVNRNFFSLYHTSIKVSNGIFSILCVEKLHKAITMRFPCIIVHRDIDITYSAIFFKFESKIIRCHIIPQVANC